MLFATIVGCAFVPQEVDEPTPVADSSPIQAEAWSRIRKAFEGSDLRNAVLMLGLETDAPRLLVKGAGDPSAIVHADSAQKWVVATVLLRAARAHGVGPDTPLSEFPFPPQGGDPARAAVTLREMLSFTGGWESPPRCASQPFGDFHTCGQSIYESEHSVPARFAYGTHHMMVAAHALTESTETYADLLGTFQSETGLFPTASNQDTEKPLRFRTNADEYYAFLQAQLRGELLTEADWQAMITDQIGDRAIASSPASALEPGWRYGYGNWLKCDPDCGAQRHSAGSRGFYPWVNLEDRTVGLIVHNARSGDWIRSHALYETIEADIPVVLGIR